MTALVHNNQLSPKIGWEAYVTLFAMFLFTLLEFGIKGVDFPAAMIFGISSINYFLVLVLYVGIAMLAYKGHTWLLWGSGIAVYVFGYMFTGLDFVWTMFSEWSMILFGGFLIGRLTLKEEKQLKVFMLGMAAVLLFAMAMYLPLFTVITEEFSKASSAMIESAQLTLPTAGYSAEETATIITSLQKSLSFTERVMPSLLLLSSVLQYSIGYLAFIFLLYKRENLSSVMTRFTEWKMPYYAAVFLLAGVAFRFFGNETISRVGDNLLVFLAIFYSICGLSLLEFYLKKMKFSPFIKFGFYLLLFITQLIGFFVAVFVGFLDSFKEFRNRDQLDLQNE